MKETYSVKCPKHIVWGDPWYFERYKGEELDKLVINIYPPNRFIARLVLQEEPCEEFPDYLIRTMTLFMAPEQTIETYMQEMMYEGQEQAIKNIGVDTACYYLKVDDYGDTIRTGGDGYWGDYQEFYRNISGNKYLDAAIVTVLMPDYLTMQQVREYVNCYFEDITKIENIEKIEEGQGMEQ